jgi:hypothetical protein
MDHQRPIRSAGVRFPEKTGRPRRCSWASPPDPKAVITIDHQLAEQEGVTSPVCRLLPPTCLVPDIVVAILDGRQPKRLRLDPASAPKGLEQGQA